MPLGTIHLTPHFSSTGCSEEPWVSEKRGCELWLNLFYFLTITGWKFVIRDTLIKTQWVEHVATRVVDMAPMEEAPQAVTYVSSSYSEMDFLKRETLSESTLKMYKNIKVQKFPNKFILSYKYFLLLF